MLSEVREGKRKRLYCTSKNIFFLTPMGADSYSRLLVISRARRSHCCTFSMLWNMQVFKHSLCQLLAEDQRIATYVLQHFCPSICLVPLGARWTWRQQLFISTPYSHCEKHHIRTFATFVNRVTSLFWSPVILYFCSFSLSHCPQIWSHWICPSCEGQMSHPH